MSEVSNNNLHISINPFILKDLIGMVMKKETLPFEAALNYIVSSRMYENLTDEKTKTWYLSSAALYDLLEEEKSKLRSSQSTDQKILLFQMFCFENYKEKEKLSPYKTMEIFSKHHVYDFLKDTYEMLHTQDSEYIISSINTYIKKINSIMKLYHGSTVVVKHPFIEPRKTKLRKTILQKGKYSAIILSIGEIIESLLYILPCAA